MKFKPVTTIEELNALNDGENIPLNSTVLSQSYSPVSIEQQELARLIVNDGYLISAYCNS